jgi:hypothetical protein
MTAKQNETAIERNWQQFGEFINMQCIVETTWLSLNLFIFNLIEWKSKLPIYKKEKADQITDTP